MGIASILTRALRRLAKLRRVVSVATQEQRKPRRQSTPAPSSPKDCDPTLALASLEDCDPVAVAILRAAHDARGQLLLSVAMQLDCDLAGVNDDREVYRRIVGALAHNLSAQKRADDAMRLILSLILGAKLPEHAVVPPDTAVNQVLRVLRELKALKAQGADA